MGQKNLLELLSRRPKRKYGETIDLTSDDEVEVEVDEMTDSMANDEMVIKAEDIEDSIKLESETFFNSLKQEDDNLEIPLDQDQELPLNEIDPNIIPCPVCQLDISKLTLSDRESHVELCLLQPTTHKSIVIPSVKKPKSELKQSRESKPRTRPIPDFKILTFKNNHKLIVDGFQFMNHPEINQYFLSHYHSDHYIGLGKKWNQGKIYTSITTANLLKQIMKISDDKIIGIPFNEKFQINDKIDVILYDANHCPGGAVFLFQEYNNKGEIIKRILHTGDFRVSYQHLKNFSQFFIDEIYLDTTYLNPVYTFMPQHQVVSKTSNFINKVVNDTIKKNSILNYFKTKNDYLIIIGAYSIGKEKLYINLAKAINSKIFITKERYKMLNCIDGFTDIRIFQTEETPDCKVHIVSINKLTDWKFLSRFQNKKIIKIKPTGWSFNTFKRPNSSIKGLNGSEILHKTINNKEIIDFENQLTQQFSNSSSLNVPYSEHSSFKELCIFGSYLLWGKIIPTVNVENPLFNDWFTLWREFKIDKSVISDYFESE